MISEEVKKILNIKDPFIDEYNLTSLITFSCIIENFIDIFKPDNITEIGCERGITTNYLSKLGLKKNFDLYCVDPSLENNNKIANKSNYKETENGKRVQKEKTSRGRPQLLFFTFPVEKMSAS